MRAARPSPAAVLARGFCVPPAGPLATADSSVAGHPRPISQWRPTAVIQLGKTADWVAIAPNAVWVGSTGPDAVHRIDPRTNKLVATVELAGEPCAGLAVGFGSVWIPLCSKPATLAKVDGTRNVVSDLFQTGPAAVASGI